MKTSLLALLLIVLANSLFAQSTYIIKADSVKITNCDSAELIIENHTQGVPGFLYNTGNGRTQFRKGLVKINGGSYLIGADTLNIGTNDWIQGGNSFGATGVLGTMDSNHLDLYANKLPRIRVFAGSGNIGINNTADNGFKLDVNGTLYTASTSMLASNALQAYPDGEVNIVGQGGHGPVLRVMSVDNNAAFLYFYVNNLYKGQVTHDGSRLIMDANSGYLCFNQQGLEVARFSPIAANLLVGTPRDIGNKLRITGSADFSGNVGVGDSIPTSRLDIQGANGFNQLRIRVQYTPTSSADTNGNMGDIAVDDNYFYYKSSTGWKRTPMSSF